MSAINAVNVRRLSITVDAMGGITVTPDPISVSGQRLLLVFSLDTAGWVFPDNGALVVTSGGDQFPYVSWTMKSQLASLFDANTSAGDFKYTINVVNSATGATYSLDPTVKNSGS